MPVCHCIRMSMRVMAVVYQCLCACVCVCGCLLVNVSSLSMRPFVYIITLCAFICLSVCKLVNAPFRVMDVCPVTAVCWCTYLLHIYLLFHPKCPAQVCWYATMEKVTKTHAQKHTHTQTNPHTNIHTRAATQSYVHTHSYTKTHTHT